MSDIHSPMRLMPTHEEQRERTERAKSSTLEAEAMPPQLVNKQGLRAWLLSLATRDQHVNALPRADQSSPSESADALSAVPAVWADEMATVLAVRGKLGLLPRAYFALKRAEMSLHRLTEESNSSVFRWLAAKGALTLAVFEGLLTPSEIRKRDQDSAAAAAYRQQRAPNILAKDLDEPSSHEQGERSKTLSTTKPPESDSTTQHETESAAEVLLLGSILLAEQQHTTRVKRERAARSDQQERHDRLAVQKEQLLSLALIDDIADQEIDLILASLNQPYASFEAALDAVRSSNLRDGEKLRLNLSRGLRSYATSPVS